MGSNGSVEDTSIDMEIALDLLERGETVASVAKDLDVPDSKLRRKIQQLQQKQGLLLQYRAIQSLQLTELQVQVLNAITPDKIDDAPLKDLVAAYKVLKDRELVIEGKPSEIKGLMAHLIYLEKQEQVLTTPVKGNTLDADFIYSDDTNENEDEGENKDNISLSDLDTDEF